MGLSFYTKFKNKFKVDFETWSKNKTVVQGSNKLEIEHSTIEDVTLVYFGTSKQIYACPVKTHIYSDQSPQIFDVPLTNEEKLILFTKGELKDEYENLILKADFDAFCNLLKPISDIISIDFVKKIDTTHFPGHVSGLKMALQAEFIHPAYAIGDAMEKAKGITFTFDNSGYRLLFKTLKVKEMYISKPIFEGREFLQDHMHELEVKHAESVMIGTNADSTNARKPTKEKIQELNNLLKDGLITQEEYNESKKKILAEL